MQVPNSSAWLAGQPYCILNAVARAPRISRGAAIIIMAHIPAVGPKVCMPRLTIIPVIVIKPPSVDGIVASTLLAQVPEQVATPIIRPLTSRGDANLSISVGVRKPAIWDGATSPIVSFGKFDVVGLRFGIRLSNRSWCCCRCTSQSSSSSDDIVFDLHRGLKKHWFEVNQLQRNNVTGW